MAINPNTNAKMSGRIIAPNGDYPYGSAKDESTLDSDDGTPYFQGRSNDVFGMQQALLNLASIVPSGNADTVLVSQYLQAMVELSQGRASNYDESGAVNAYVLTKKTNQFVPASLFDRQEFYFTANNTSTGVATIDLLGLGIKTITNSSIAGSILAGVRYGVIYRLGTDDVVLMNQYVSSTTNVYVTTTGTNTAYIVDLGISEYVVGNVYKVDAHIANVGAATITISGLPAKSLKVEGGANVSAGQFLGAVQIYYDGTDMLLLVPAVAAPDRSRSYLSADQQIGTNFTVVQFNIKNYDVGGIYDETTLYRATPKIEGYYDIWMALQWTAVTVGHTISGGIFKNTVQQTSSINIARITSPPLKSFDSIYANGSSDYFDIRVKNQNSATSSVVGSSLASYLIVKFTGK